MGGNPTVQSGAQRGRARQGVEIPRFRVATTGTVLLHDFEVRTLFANYYPLAGGWMNLLK